ncbi:MAG TPA: membrane dipeptidase [Gemmatimonadaceae bacterium]|jgi:membrane dipeptidase|nr:membrane dipeptidase [Gemmatimonadaceae bacterium]HPV73316.1 membrane dipeptidase [Gemmatimonadaceae bacterium]
MALVRDHSVPGNEFSRREALKRLAAGVVAAPAILRGRYPLFRPADARFPVEYSARAIKLVQESVVIDLLNQFRFADFAEKPPKSQLWLSKPRSMTSADWEVYRTSGYTVMCLGHSPRDYADGLRFFAEWNGFVAEYPEWFARVDDARDFEAVKKAGKVGIMITFQNSDHFRSPDDVDQFYSLGQRLSQLTYNYQNRIGSGFLEERDGGLTVFGKSIVQRMEQVGMAVDVSHCADRTTLDALDIAKRPVVFSHASARALMPDHARCKTDEMITKMAKTGGVMGIPFLRMMVSPTEPVTVEHALNHFDHVRKLVGIEHLAMGSDMDVVGNPNPVNGPGQGNPATPNFERYHLHTNDKGEWLLTVPGLDHPKRTFDIVEGLIRRGYTDQHIAMVLGGNAMRVFRNLWGQ